MRDGPSSEYGSKSARSPSRRIVLLRFLYHVLIALILIAVMGSVVYAGIMVMDLWFSGSEGNFLADILPLSGGSASDSSAAESPVLPASGSPAGPEALGTPTPRPTSRTEARLAAAARIRIPAIEVDRAVIKLPLVQDPKTGGWEQDFESLFRTGRNDLVGHWDGSAQPGEPGNMILVGHNYGYGQTGVFLKLGRLKPGQEVYVITRGGETYPYRVRAVDRISWRRKDLNEMVQHSQYLSLGGEDRLTLVTCGGASRAPFPQNIYVVAEPVR